ncbi:DUF983 domain-containing protein [Novosphingobium arvoryzae]|uniref:DUF983 domain-containing protein n=1 Tax=Novosphingobium arvoryzae TaxID=1256514 RepID=A0A918VMT6_9SPHN|nr:DUF983 domain-containing protein [Novosphingobium arvoryzae]GHA08541.1 hypothetical protein GCM10011617_31320 [Novosphingobium arvoryzae]
MTLSEASRLPATLMQAMLRGARFRCPRCDSKGLFARYLKPASSCSHCGQDWTLHQADDFPPYVSMFITGHLMAPVIIEIGSSQLSMAAQLAIAFGLGSVLMIGLLQPAKGAIIALQWWMGMHGFKPAGKDEAEAVFGPKA